jgi:hypothetical protein
MAQQAANNTEEQFAINATFAAHSVMSKRPWILRRCAVV